MIRWRQVPRRRAAHVAALALLAGLTSCSVTDSSTGLPSAEPPSSTSSPTSSGTPDNAPSEQPGAQGDALDAALSEPVEDSVYPDVGDPSVDSLSYDLDLSWDPGSRTLAGEEQLTFRSTGDADHVQLDMAEQLEVSSLTVDGEEASYEHTGKDLVVTGDFVAQERYEVTVVYSGSPEPVPAPTTRADFDTVGFTVAPDSSAWTMQEPFGAYTWYAVNDQPSDKAFYDFTLRVPEPWVGVANGELADQASKNGQTVTTWHLDSKTSSYLVTVAFGPYKATTTESTSGVPITYWVPTSASGYLDALQFTPDALDWVEQKLGPYPWSSLGVLLVASQSGMETQTMITLGSTFYATSNNVLVHEIVHQWYGDRVTPSDWRDLWMNEGMAMYLELTWQAETQGIPLQRYLERVARFERRSRRVNGPPAEYDPKTFGEIQVYYGPALMWEQIRRRVGDEKFWEMVKAWPEYDADGTVDRDEYLPWVEEQTGVELSDLFDGWLFAKRSPRFP